MRLITHLKWNLLKFPSCKEAFVESNESEVVILLFFLKDLGLEKLWIHNGKGKIADYLLVHDIVFDNLSVRFCRVLLKAHIGPRCEYLSKIGNKKNALVAKPEGQLNLSGELNHLTEENISLVEQYLVVVYSGVRTIGKRTVVRQEL